MVAKLLTVDTQKALAKLSMQVQETARAITNQRMTLVEMLQLKNMLDVHASNMQHMFEMELNRQNTPDCFPFNGKKRIQNG